MKTPCHYLVNRNPITSSAGIMQPEVVPSDSNLPSTHVHRTGIHNLTKETQEMYDTKSKIYDGIIEVSEYFLGPMDPPAPTSQPQGGG